MFKINDRLEAINYLIGAYKEETVAITAARKAVRKALKVLSERIEKETNDKDGYDGLYNSVPYDAR